MSTLVAIYHPVKLLSDRGALSWYTYARFVLERYKVLVQLNILQSYSGDIVSSVKSIYDSALKITHFFHKTINPQNV